MSEVKLDTLLSSSIIAWELLHNNTSYCVEHASVISRYVIAKLGKMNIIGLVYVQ